MAALPRFLCTVIAAVAAGQAQAAEPDYPPVVPGRVIELPRDTGSHPQYRIEWWYVTGWLDVPERAPHGFQVTFFRVRSGVGEDNPSKFAPRQVLFAHAAVADSGVGRLRHAERSAREGFDLAYAREGATDVRIDDWSLRDSGGGRLEAVAASSDFALRLALATTQPALLQGEAGYSRKGTENVVGPMPPFKDIVKSEDDMWKIVSWIKSLAKSK